ncbi:MAG: sensor histidine kinase, partial [Candidatus Brocadiae bacterium]|nr:sensor histidine kinase [Candidatus Brocadiia bacterium]
MLFDSSVMTYFMWDGIRVLKTEDGAGALKQRQVHGHAAIPSVGDIAMMERSDSQYVPAADQVGTIWKVLHPSAGTANSYEYDAFGVGHSASEAFANPFRRAGMLVMGQDITEQRQAEEELLRYQEQLRSLASRLSTTEERERQRIAGDLHDQIGQALAIAVMKLGVLRDSAPDRGLDDVAQLIEGALQATRSLTTELSPPVLHELGFGAALEWLAEEAQERDGLRVEVEDDGQSEPLDGRVGVVLFKAVRELVVNVARHSRAKNVKVSVRRHGDEVRIAVRDDGVGFDPSEHHLKAVVEGGFGLFNIREQLSHLRGRLTIVSQPGRGTTVSL